MSNEKEEVKKDLERAISRIDDGICMLEMAVSYGGFRALLFWPFVWALLKGMRWLATKMLSACDE